METMLPIIFAMAGAAFIAGGFGAAKGQDGRRFANPIALFLVVYGCLYFVAPAILIGAGRFRHATAYSESALAGALLYLLLFGVAVLIGYYLAGGNVQYARFRRRPTGLWKPTSRVTLFAIAIVVLVPALISVAALVAEIARYGYGAFLANRIVLGTGEGYLSMLRRWPLVLLLVVYTRGLVLRRYYGQRQPIIVVALLLALTLVIAALDGSRTEIAIPFVMMAACHTVFSRVSRIPVAKLVMIAGMIFVVVLLGEVRQQLMSGAGVDIGEAAKGSTFVDVAYNVGEYENLVWMMDRPEAFQYLHGRTFAAAVVGWVPRRAWPDKPLGGGPYLRNFIVPGSYDLGGRNITSYTPGLPAEAYMNFGWLGLLVAPLYGVGLALLARWINRIAGPLTYVCWWSIMFGMLLCLRGEFFGVTARVFMMVVPLVIGMVVAGLMSNRGRVTTAVYQRV